MKQEFDKKHSGTRKLKLDVEASKEQKEGLNRDIKVLERELDRLRILRL